MAGALTVQFSGKATAAAVGFLTRLVGPLADVSDIVSDKIRYVRWKTAMKRVKAASKFAAKAGIKPSQVPLKFLVPFLEKCSLEDDDEVSKLWEKLLANAANNFVWKQALFISLLEQVGRDEAVFLKTLVRSCLKSEKGAKPALEYRSFADTGEVLQELGKGLANLAEKHSFSNRLRAKGGSDVPPIKKRREPKFASMEMEGALIRYLKKEGSPPNCRLLSENATRDGERLLEKEYAYVNDYAHISESVLLLERLGLVRLSEKHFGFGLVNVRLVWAEATSLGFDLVAHCDFVPAIQVNRPRLVSSFYPKSTNGKRSE